MPHISQTYGFATNALAALAESGTVLPTDVALVAVAVLATPASVAVELAEVDNAAEVEAAEATVGNCGVTPRALPSADTPEGNCEVTPRAVAPLLALAVSCADDAVGGGAI